MILKYWHWKANIGVCSPKTSSYHFVLLPHLQVIPNSQSTKMVDLKLCFYGISLLIGFLLHVVGTVSNSIFIYYFKPVWAEKHLANFGIDLGVPVSWNFPDYPKIPISVLVGSLGQGSCLHMPLIVYWSKSSCRGVYLSVLWVAKPPIFSEVYIFAEIHQIYVAS